MENLGWGLEMTALGMGLVFALLGLLWGLLTLVLVLDKEVPEPIHEASAPADALPLEVVPAISEQTPKSPTVNGMPADLVAAIMVATLKHRMTLRHHAEPVMRSNWPGSQLFASRWVAAGRTRQNTNWQPRGK